VNVAAKVRKAKEKSPELYCSDPRCLWRVVTPTGFKACAKHPHLNKRAEEDNR
jgi:hypothetical protein